MARERESIVVLKDILNRNISKELKRMFLRSYVSVYGRIPPEYKEYIEETLGE